MNIELGLEFEPKSKKFREMISGLQSMLEKTEQKWFFLDATFECEGKFSSSFLGPSNKLTGWLVEKDEKEYFMLAYSKKDLEHYQNKRTSIWSYWDGEYSGGWLYSFEGPIFGEVDICE